MDGNDDDYQTMLLMTISPQVMPILMMMIMKIREKLMTMMIIKVEGQRMIIKDTNQALNPRKRLTSG